MLFSITHLITSSSSTHQFTLLIRACKSRTVKHRVANSVHLAKQVLVNRNHHASWAMGIVNKGLEAVWSELADLKKLRLWILSSVECGFVHTDVIHIESTDTRHLCTSKVNSVTAHLIYKITPQSSLWKSTAFPVSTPAFPVTFLTYPAFLVALL